MSLSLLTASTPVLTAVSSYCVVGEGRYCQWFGDPWRNALFPVAIPGSCRRPDANEAVMASGILACRGRSSGCMTYFRAVLGCRPGMMSRQIALEYFSSRSRIRG